MGSVFVPYSGDTPVAVDINGHRLVFLSTEPDALEAELELLGGERVEVYSRFDSRAELERATTELAKTCDAGVVIAPADVSISDLLKNLESELPWVQ